MGENLTVPEIEFFAEETLISILPLFNDTFFSHTPPNTPFSHVWIYRLFTVGTLLPDDPPHASNPHAPRGVAKRFLLFIMNR